MIGERPPVARLGMRVVTPLALVVATQLLLAGHNRPGGGFSAGLVLGAVVALGRIAGIRAKVDAVTVIGIGIAVMVATVVAPVLTGSQILDMGTAEWALPVFDKVKFGSALVFDVGVALVVVGLVIGVLDGLGNPDPEPSEDDADMAHGGGS